MNNNAEGQREREGETRIQATRWPDSPSLSPSFSHHGPLDIADVRQNRTEATSPTAVYRKDVESDDDRCRGADRREGRCSFDRGEDNFTRVSVGRDSGL